MASQGHADLFTLEKGTNLRSGLARNEITIDEARELQKFLKLTPAGSSPKIAIIDAADEMYRDTMVSDESWTRLSEHYDTHQMMSIAWTVARYRRVSMVLNALGVQPLADDERFPVLEGY